MNRKILCCFAISLMGAILVAPMLQAQDNRQDWYQIQEDEDLLFYSRAQCAQVGKGQLTLDGDVYHLGTESWTQGMLPDDTPAPLCPDVRFYGQQRVFWASGVLVGDDLVAVPQPHHALR